MNRRISAAMLLAAMLAGQPVARAESAPVELKWSELSSHIQGRDIELILPDGTSLAGSVEAIREDALVLNVHHTSNSQAHPAGNAVVRRESVSVVLLHESRGKWGRSIGVVLGTLTGLAVGGAVLAEGARIHSAAGGTAVLLGITGAGTLAGYYLGKSADRRATQFKVIP
jgi:hypothetical protein